MDSGEDTYEKFAIAILQLCLNPDSNIFIIAKVTVCHAQDIK